MGFSDIELRDNIDEDEELKVSISVWDPKASNTEGQEDNKKQAKKKEKAEKEKKAKQKTAVYYEKNVAPKTDNQLSQDEELLRIEKENREAEKLRVEQMKRSE